MYSKYNLKSSLFKLVLLGIFLATLYTVILFTQLMNIKEKVNLFFKNRFLEQEGQND
jgi:hypothetical protein